MATQREQLRGAQCPKCGAGKETTREKTRESSSIKGQTKSK